MKKKMDQLSPFFLNVLGFFDNTLFTLGLPFCVLLSFSNNGTQVQPTAMDT